MVKPAGVRLVRRASPVHPALAAELGRHPDLGASVCRSASAARLHVTWTRDRDGWPVPVRCTAGGVDVTLTGERLENLMDLLALLTRPGESAGTLCVMPSAHD